MAISAEMQKVEYIWADGFEGSESKGLVFNEMRSKTKVLQKSITSGNPKDFPDWSFDGSSTGQAEGNNSDCILDPVAVYPDPIRGAPHVLVMCQVRRCAPGSAPSPCAPVDLDAILRSCIPKHVFMVTAFRRGMMDA